MYGSVTPNSQIASHAQGFLAILIIIYHYLENDNHLGKFPILLELSYVGILNIVAIQLA